MLSICSNWCDINKLCVCHTVCVCVSSDFHNHQMLVFKMLEPTGSYIFTSCNGEGLSFLLKYGLKSTSIQRKFNRQVVNVNKCCSQWPRRTRVSNNTHSPTLEFVDCMVSCSLSYIFTAILNYHISTPFASTLWQLNIVHILKFCLFVLHLIVFCHLHLRLPNGSLPSGFQPKLLYISHLAHV